MRCRRAIDGRRTTSYSYDAASGALATVTDGRSNVTRTGYTDGRLTTLTDRRGKAWTYAYGTPDASGALTTTRTAPVSSGVTSATAYRISGRGPVRDGDPRMAGGNILSITDAGHGTTTTPITTNYAWEANRLIRTTDGAGAVTEFKYNDLGLLTEVREPSPNDTARTDLPTGAPKTAIVSALRYRYPTNQPRYGSPCAAPATPAGSSISTEGWCEFVAENERVALATNVSDQLRIRDFAYDEAGNVSRAVERAAPSLTQAPSALPSSADRATAFTYYSRGGLRTVDGPRTDVADVTTLGDTGDATYGGYDRTGMPASFTDAVGKAKTFAYTPYGMVAKAVDRDARVTRTRYDERNNAREVWDAADKRTDHAFDANDNKVSETSPKGTATTTTGDFTTTFTYDGNDWLTQRSEPGETATAPRRVTTTAYFDDGTKSSETTPRPATTTYAYWPNRLLKSTTAPAGTGQSAVTDHFYDAAGRPNRIVHPTTTAADERPVTQRTYAPDGDVAVEKETSAVAGEMETTRFARNAHREVVQTLGPRTVGGVVAETISGYDRFGQELQKRRRLDASRFVDTFSGYDLAGNQVGNEQPTGTGARLDTTYRFDALNRLAAQTSDPVNPGHTVDYTYFGEGQQNERLDKVNGVTRRSSASAYNPDRSEQSFVSREHDGAGKVVATLARCNYAEGATPASGYDADGRLLVSRTVSGTGGCTGTAQRTQTFAYDERGWMTTSTQTVRSPQTGAGVTRSQSYDYDADGERRSVTHDGNKTAYEHSPAGWNEKVTDWLGRQSTTAYRPSGAVATQLRNGGSARATWTHHANGLPSALTWARRKGDGAYESVRSHTSIAYDVGGLRTSEQVAVLHPASAPLTASTGGQTTTAHDLLDRLVSWKSPFAEPVVGQPTTTYALDDGGNIVEERVEASGVQQARTTSTYANGRLSGRSVERLGEPTQTESFGYTGLGEEQTRVAADALATEVDTLTTHDPAGHTKTVDDRRASGTEDKPVVDVDYVYDADDRVISRVERPASGGTRTTLYFYWGSGSSLAEETDGAGSAMVRYLLAADGKHLAQESWRKSDGSRDTAATWAWLLPDPAGNTATHLANDGTVLEQVAYDAYGSRTSPAQPRPPSRRVRRSGTRGL